MKLFRKISMLSLKDHMLSNFQKIQMSVVIVENQVVQRNIANVSERIKDAIKNVIVLNAKIANQKKLKVVCLVNNKQYIKRLIFQRKRSNYKKNDMHQIIFQQIQQIFLNHIIMDYYYSYIGLLGLREANLTPFKDERIQRYKSVKKMIELLRVCVKLGPLTPIRIFHLDQYDPQWDDIMPFPTINYEKYAYIGLGLAFNLFFYSYNYNTLTTNIRLRTFRYAFPIINAALFFKAYTMYKTSILKINYFDEYCWLRAQELVQQNTYLLKHPDVQKFIWFYEDLADTLKYVHRQANENKASDFKDSELILQDFISRYTDPSSDSPMKNARALHL